FGADGDDLYPERTRHCEDHFHDLGICLFVRRGPDKRPIDLESCYGQPHKAAEIRIAGSEIVYVDRNAELSQCVQHLCRAVFVITKSRFRDLKVQVLCRKIRFPQDVFDRIDELSVRELPRRKIDAESKILVDETVADQGTDLRTCFVHYLRRKVVDHSDLLGKFDEPPRRKFAKRRMMPPRESFESLQIAGR